MEEDQFKTGSPSKTVPADGGGRAESAAPFWRSKSLVELSRDEWESLCDGCGKCCLVLLEEDDGVIYETDVACQLFDPAARRCRDYANRRARVPDCVRLTPANAGALPWMPQTCAYGRLARGEDLPDWHPLVTGDPLSTEKAGQGTPRNLALEHEISEKQIWARKLIEQPRTSKK